MDANDVMTDAREGRIPGRSEADLSEMLKVLGTYKAANSHCPRAEFALVIVRDELEQLRRSRDLAELRDQNQQIRKAVEKLQLPHWTQRWGFWVTVLATILAGIAAWPIAREWFPKTKTKMLPSRQIAPFVSTTTNQPGSIITNQSSSAPTNNQPPTSP